MSDLYLKGKVGPDLNGDGAEVAARFGYGRDLIVAEAHGRYAESTIRGKRFCLSLPATTTGVAAGNITGAAAAASTQFALWNPPGSKVLLVLDKLIIGLISGTIVGGPLFHNVFNAAALSVGQTLTNGAHSNLRPDGPSPTGKGWAVAAGSALTGGGPLTAIRPSSLTYSAGTYAALGGSGAIEQFDGDIVIPPGYGYVPCFQAAGTSVLNAWGLVYEEVPTT